MVATDRSSKAATTVYSILSIVVTVYMIVTLIKAPLFPFQTGNTTWLAHYLNLTVVDFYVMVLCLGGIAIVTDGAAGWAWALGMAVIGSPIACVYVAYKARHSTLRLGAVREPVYGTLG